MTEIAVIDDKAQALAVEAQSIKTRAVSVLVRSPHEYELAAGERAAIKAKHREIEARRVHLKAPALEQCRRIDEFFREPLQFLKDAETAYGRAMLSYQDEERRAATEEQRKRDEEARQQREALEAKARAERAAADREAAELRRKEEAARKAGDLAAAVTLRSQSERLVEESEERAIEIESKAETVVAERIVAEVPVVQGVSTRTIWRARVVNAKLVPDEYKVVNDKMLQDTARATKGKVQIPGVEFYAEQKLAQRA